MFCFAFAFAVMFYNDYQLKYSSVLLPEPNWINISVCYEQILH